MFRAFLPLLDFIYPPVCLSCGERRDSRDSRVCSVCWSGILPVDERSALFRETESALRAGAGISGLVSAYVFEREGTLQALLHALKYAGNSAIGRELGVVLAGRVAATPWAPRITAVIPVPLHRVKKRERGYNQAEVVAEAVARALGVPLATGLLARVRQTATQTHLGAGERQQNVAGAFRVTSAVDSRLKGGRFLVVDDVVTTGATLGEAAGVLLSAGAAECYAGTIAIAAL